MRQFAMFSMTFQMAHHVLHYAAVEILAPHIDEIFMEGSLKAAETGNGQYVDESVAKGKQLIRFYGRKKLIELGILTSEESRPLIEIWTYYLGSLRRNYRQFFYDTHQYFYFGLLEDAVRLPEQLLAVVKENTDEEQQGDQYTSPALLRVTLHKMLEELKKEFTVIGAVIEKDITMPELLWRMVHKARESIGTYIQSTLPDPLRWILSQPLYNGAHFKHLDENRNSVIKVPVLIQH